MGASHTRKARPGCAAGGCWRLAEEVLVFPVGGDRRFKARRRPNSSAADGDERPVAPRWSESPWRSLRDAKMEDHLRRYDGAVIDLPGKARLWVSSGSRGAVTRSVLSSAMSSSC